ncbi:GntR family transcriptional regulator [Domibacillus sp. DTU_2020_1001157_1_SI_ALB_TIR_016]|uniref:GntR family transcriptional regulator n=1 Tax=Domibacillus sp. DTU_2020_1001157_1_SI_ALB_TIR_016 TaxID=3077789 RepID=UPI0028E873A9|nr:GntR family transcriptional regulator [Domibacillus sp. DTU_2020_1001157_1_SI_ALB_TIR_016]WNS79119.1 GntR family transcriptional regulator [Domibacillus sp. DTU_2020_1001157_1_SI_ALB_TIR_016]
MRDEAYNTLLEWIVLGKLEPDTKLKDQELSEVLGISRTPIREALLKLEDEGLVVTKANRWTQVAPINPIEAENIYSIGWTLECLALEQSVPLITSKDIAELEALNERFYRILGSGDKLAAIEADNEFHNKIIQLPGNAELVKMLEGVKVKIKRMELYYFQLNSRKPTSYEEHKQIIEALKRKNAVQAKEALKANWKNSLDRIRMNMN